MKRGRGIIAALAATLIAGSAAADVVWNQDFNSGNTDGWLDGENGWYGDIEHVENGADDYATVTQTSTGPFSAFDGYRNTWTPWTASIDIYLDPSTFALGEGFDYSVASSNNLGVHRRDFIFHVTMDTSTGDLLVGGSNNTNYNPREDLESLNHYEITIADWYTFEHDFYDLGDGTLAVDLNLYNSGGTLLFTETRNDASDIIASVIGGNRYSWFTNIDVAGGIMIDNHMLTLNTAVVPVPPAAAIGLLGVALVAVRRRFSRSA